MKLIPNFKLLYRGTGTIKDCCEGLVMTSKVQYTFIALKCLFYTNSL